jgi:hypothetical protein
MSPEGAGDNVRIIAFFNFWVSRAVDAVNMIYAPVSWRAREDDLEETGAIKSARRLRFDKVR